MLHSNTPVKEIILRKKYRKKFFDKNYRQKHRVATKFCVEAQQVKANCVK